MTKEKPGEKYEIEKLKIRKIRHEVIAGVIRIMFNLIFVIMHSFGMQNKRPVIHSTIDGVATCPVGLML